MDIAQSFFQVSQDAQIFTQVAIKSTIKSNGKFFNVLHNFGKHKVPFENRVIRIKCQPTALATRKRHAVRSSVSSRKKTTSFTNQKITSLQRKRNLALNVKENGGNAKTPGVGHYAPNSSEVFLVFV